MICIPLFPFHPPKTFLDSFRAFLLFFYTICYKNNQYATKSKFRIQPA